MSENNKRKRDNNDDSNTSKIVKLSVGGRKHEVSRDLFMDNNKCTMLSRLVSKTWLQDPEKEISIDRNGDTFSHVLDYLRHGEIMLPKTVTKDTFLKELDFYGIEVAQGSVKSDNTSAEILNEYKDLERIVDEKKEKYEEAKNELIEAEKALNYEKQHLQKATEMLNYYHKFATNKSSQCHYEFYYFDLDENLINKYLGKFGIKVEDRKMTLLK